MTVENAKNTSNDGPLTVLVLPRSKSSFVCAEKKRSSYLEYHCIPPVKGDALYINGPSFNTTLVLCYVTVLALGKSYWIFKENWSSRKRYYLRIFFLFKNLLFFVFTHLNMYFLVFIFVLEFIYFFPVRILFI